MTDEGLLVDSCVVVTAERQAVPVSALLERLRKEHGMTEIVLSSISVVELDHAIHRAQSPQQALKRRIYLDTVFAAIPVEPFTRNMGRVAAQIDAEARAKGIVIPFADLLIGSTAIYLGYKLLTSNLRHFLVIPGLTVIPF